MSARVRNLIAYLEGNAPTPYPSGTSGSFNNNGGGGQNFSGSRINSGAHSGDGNGSHNWNNYGGTVVNNKGINQCNGNKSIINGGNFGPSGTSPVPNEYPLIPIQIRIQISKDGDKYNDLGQINLEMGSEMKNILSTHSPDNIYRCQLYKV